MKIKYPLYLQTLLFLLLHMFVLLTLFLLFFNTQFGMGWGAIVTSPLGDRVDSIAALMHEQMPAGSSATWNDVLKQFGKLYGVNFYIFDRRGHQVAGAAIVLPDDVKEQVVRRRGRTAGDGVASVDRTRGSTDGQPGAGRGSAVPMGASSSIPAHPDCFWIGTRFGIPVAPSGEDAVSSPSGPAIIPGTLLAGDLPISGRQSHYFFRSSRDRADHRLDFRALNFDMVPVRFPRHLRSSGSDQINRAHC